MPNPILIVQGGQWGSEAKGAIAGYLCKSRKIDIAVRTGATNAGHTVIRNGVSFKMQQLPVGFVNPDTTLVIGAGALIDPEILYREVGMINHRLRGDVRDRLKIDYRAGLHVPAHANRSKASGRHHAIGATGKGCSEALVDRIRGRGDPSYHLFGDSAYSANYDVCDTEAYLNWSWNEGAKILLEGTQGQLLDLYLGPYPYTTHKQTGPAQWMLEAGLSPSLPTEIWMVVRTFPIRVAGNSGPMPQEISWPILAREINDLRVQAGQPYLISETDICAFEEAVRSCSLDFRLPGGSKGLDQHEWSSAQREQFRVALSELHRAAWDSLPDDARTRLMRLFELTTVTRKLRRIARLDRGSLEVSARQIRPHVVALTFMNYLFPRYWFEKPKQASPEIAHTAKQILEVCAAPVKLMTFGPADEHVMEV